MEISSNLRTQLKQIASLTAGEMHRKYYGYLAEHSKDINVVPLREAFTEEEIETIKKHVRIEKKECYKNASRLCGLFPDKVKYCEGQMNCYGLGIDHAWNKVGDVYVDITSELALGDDEEKIRNTEYLLFGEYDYEVLVRVLMETEYYGDVFRHLFFEKYGDKK